MFRQTVTLRDGRRVTAKFRAPCGRLTDPADLHTMRMIQEPGMTTPTEAAERYYAEIYGDELVAAIFRLGA